MKPEKCRTLIFSRHILIAVIGLSVQPIDDQIAD